MEADIVVVLAQNRKQSYLDAVRPHLQYPLEYFQLGSYGILKNSEFEALLEMNPKVVVFLDDIGGSRECAIKLKDSPIVTVEFADGQLDWTCIWENTDTFEQPLYQPIVCDRFAAYGLPQIKVLESWGNTGKCELVGFPRFDIYKNLEPAPHDKWRLLICSGFNPCYSPYIKSANTKCIMDLKAFVDANQDWIEPIWRISPYITEELKIENSTSELLHDSFVEVLRRSDAIISTPSTVLLEAMLFGIPAALIDYTNLPAYIQTAWRIFSPEQIPAAVQSMQQKENKYMLFQENIVDIHMVHQYKSAEKAAELLNYLVGWVAAGKTKAELPYPILRWDDQPSSLIHRQSYDVRELYKGHSVFGKYEQRTLEQEVVHLRKKCQQLENALAKR